MNFSQMWRLAMVAMLLMCALAVPGSASADVTGKVIQLGGSLDLYNADVDQTVRITFERDWLPLSNLYKVTVWDLQDPEIVWAKTFKKGTSRTITLNTQQFRLAPMVLTYDAKTGKISVTDGGGWS